MSLEYIAVIIGNQILYWNDLVLTFAALGAVCLFLSLYCGCDGKILQALSGAALSVALSLAFSRLIHWYCSPDTYSGIWQALTAPEGGFVLLGCFPGCALAAAATGGGFHRSRKMLDCMSIAGCGGIAIGRLASFFDVSGRGPILSGFKLFPLAVPVANPVSGQLEYRLATFMLQAMVTALLFFFLLSGYRKKGRRDGQVTRIFLLCYCASQVLLDSTRYDSLYFPFNRFVSVVQVACGVTIGFILLDSGLRLVRRRGISTWLCVLWVTQAGLMACAGYMEYYVQRHGNQAAAAYAVMALALCGICLTYIGSTMPGRTAAQAALNGEAC